MCPNISLKLYYYSIVFLTINKSCAWVDDIKVKQIDFCKILVNYNTYSKYVPGPHKLINTSATDNYSTSTQVHSILSHTYIANYDGP